MSENIRQITIYLPEYYANWIENYAEEHHFSLSGAVCDLLARHIDKCLKPESLKVEDPYTGKVTYDLRFLARYEQHKEDRERQEKLTIEKAKKEGKLVDLKNYKD
jgi:hypothetical protein